MKNLLQFRYIFLYYTVITLLCYSLIYSYFKILEIIFYESYNYVYGNNIDIYTSIILTILHVITISPTILTFKKDNIIHFNLILYIIFTNKSIRIKDVDDYFNFNEQPVNYILLYSFKSLSFRINDDIITVNGTFLSKFEKLLTNKAFFKLFFLMNYENVKISYNKLLDNMVDSEEYEKASLLKKMSDQFNDQKYI